DRAGRAARPRIHAQGHGALLRRDAWGARTPWRLGGEVHRRRGDGRLRHPAAPRGRRSARRSRRRRHAYGARGPQRRARTRPGPSTRMPHRREPGGAEAADIGRVTGDAGNTAARLEAAAGPSEILIGDATELLVRDAVQTEPVEPLSLKGKAEPRPAPRLVE